MISGIGGGAISMVPRTTLASNRPAEAVSPSVESMVVSALRVYFCLHSGNFYHIKTYIFYVIYKHIYVCLSFIQISFEKKGKQFSPKLFSSDTYYLFLGFLCE